MSTTPSNGNNTDICYWYDSTGKTNCSSVCATHINKYLTAVSSYKTPDYFRYSNSTSTNSNNECYWSSSECDQNLSYYANFRGDDYMFISGRDCGKNCAFIVRSVLAF